MSHRAAEWLLAGVGVGRQEDDGQDDGNGEEHQEQGVVHEAGATLIVAEAAPEVVDEELDAGEHVISNHKSFDFRLNGDGAYENSQDLYIIKYFLVDVNYFLLIETYDLILA